MPVRGAARKIVKKPAPKCWARPSVSNGKPTEGRTRLALLCGLRYIPNERTCTTGGKVAGFSQQRGRILCDGFHYHIEGDSKCQLATSGSSTRTPRQSGDGGGLRRMAASLASRAKVTTTALTAKRTLAVTAGLASPQLGRGRNPPPHNCPRGRCTWLSLRP
jgi:hypothetical protein